MATLHFRRSTRKMALLLVGSLAFVAGGGLMIRTDPATAHACIVFFGLCALVSAINLHPRSSFLEVSAEGFTFANLFRRTFVPWGHVAEFLPIAIHHNALVGWNYSPGFDGQAAARKISAALSGVEAALPDTYGMSAEKLAAVLNEFLLKHRR